MTTRMTTIRIMPVFRPRPAPIGLSPGSKSAIPVAWVLHPVWVRVQVLVTHPAFGHIIGLPGPNAYGGIYPRLGLWQARNWYYLTRNGRPSMVIFQPKVS